MNFVRLKDILSIHKGRKNLITDNPSKDSIRVLQIDDLRNDLSLKYTDEKNGVWVREDDLMIAWDGANAGTIGYGKTGYVGSTIAALKKIEPRKYSTPFLGYFLQSQFEFFQKTATGATIPHIDRRSLENLSIPSLSIEDQIRIATILSKAEALIAQRKESIRLLDEFLKSTFLEMFGDPVSNSKNQKLIRLGELGDWRSGGTPSRSNSEYFQGDIPWITSGELNDIYIGDSIEKITEEAVANSNASKISHGSLLLGMYDTAALKSSITKGIVSCNQAIAFAELKPELCNTLFVYFNIQLGKEYFRSQQRGVRQKNMNLSMIKNLRMLSPSVELQNEFASVAEKALSLKEIYKQSLSEIENLFNSLSQRAFKGELDLNTFEVVLPDPESLITKPVEKPKKVRGRQSKIAREYGDPFEGKVMPEDRLITLGEAKKILGNEYEEISDQERQSKKIDSAWLQTRTVPVNERGRIKFNNAEGWAILDTVFFERNFGFTSNEFIAFLQGEGIAFDSDAIANFFANALDKKRIVQHYSKNMEVETRRTDSAKQENIIWFAHNVVDK